MNEEIIAARYARACFNVARDEDAVEATRDALNAFAAATTGDNDLRRYWADPTITHEDKRAVLDEIFQKTGVQGHLAAFLRLLVDSNRYHLLPCIEAEFQELSRRHLNEAVAVVASALDLNQARLDDIRKSLEEKTGKKIVLRTEKDPSLLGGIVVQMEGVVFDGSIRGWLGRMRREMAGR